jgi:signal transduction histidine kinase
MTKRRSLKVPITLAVVMIVLLIILLVGWILVSVFGAMEAHEMAPFYWTALPLGAVFMVILLLGVVAYLVISIKIIGVTQQQSNFIDSVTHELKSPIAALKLYLQTLDRRSVNEERQAEFHHAMLEEVERLDHLTTQILDAGRVETGREVGERELLELDELIRDCGERLRKSYRADEESVVYDLQPCECVGRRVEIEIVLRNLIDNALKYSSEPPRVELFLRRRTDGKLQFRVADNGQGIAPAMQKKIFGRFVRLGLELQRKKPGTGLGLYIVLSLVRTMRGEIAVFNRPEGGAVFEVILPADMKNR